MKRATVMEAISIEDEEDEDFLSQIAAAEAQALSTTPSSKRFKPSTTTTSTSSTTSTTTTLHPQPKQETQFQQGAYLAALRGEDTSYRYTNNAKYNSLQSRVVKGTRLKVVADDTELGFGGGNMGLKLGDSGDGDVPEKACPCGLGTCLILTANTERNRGRKFYKCPVREENGGCGFFDWCDNASGSANINRLSHNSMHNCSFPELPCPCGAGSCLILTAKTENNFGRQFYRCPGNQGASCGFFKWCNDNSAEACHSANASNVHNNFGDSANNSYGVRTPLACFKCGKEGHWAKDCSFSSSAFSSNLGGKQSSGSCYKCGKPGHWAKDCASPSSNMNTQQRQ